MWAGTGRALCVAALALGAAGARAQEGVAESESDGRPLGERCEALVLGEAPEGDVAELRSRCAALVRASSVVPAERTEGAVGREPPQAGESVAAAFSTAGRELAGQGGRQPAGMRDGGPVRNTLMTNPLGWFSGLGVNATLFRAVERYDKLSWVGQARYSRTNASNGNVTAFGLGAGTDFFVFGRNNEGLRIGPRVSVAFGAEDFGGTTSFARLGLSGEFGYNFIASNGVSASAAGGFGGRLAGDSQNEQFESFTGGEFGPYLTLGLGYSW